MVCVVWMCFAFNCWLEVGVMVDCLGCLHMVICCILFVVMCLFYFGFVGGITLGGWMDWFNWLVSLVV